MTSSIIPVGAGRAWRACSVVLVLMLGAAGCVVQDERPMAPVVAQKATAEIPQAELLDVGVRIAALPDSSLVAVPVGAT